MQTQEISTILTQIACTFSIIGSSLVILSWLMYENRKKHGKILLGWLSVADLFSSLIYLLQTIIPPKGLFCEVTAALGIFFPVASFIWTDFVAYYMYLVLHKRNIPSARRWKFLLRCFHVVAWGIAAAILICVVVFQHAGSSNSENTGGWCWIVAGNSTELLIWELIGGKAVEWLSCFVIVPFLYLSTIRNMVRLGHVRSAAKLSAMAGSGGGGGAQSYDSSYASPPPSTSRRGRIQGRGLYSPFYGKLALVPIVFIFIRLGSSIRVWYKFATGDDNSLVSGPVDATLLYLQAVFDPSQGFFNAVIFVLTSQSERNKMLSFFTGGMWTPIQCGEDRSFDHGDGGGGGEDSLIGLDRTDSGAEMDFAERLLVPRVSSGDSLAFASGISEPLLDWSIYESDDDEGDVSYDDEDR